MTSTILVLLNTKVVFDPKSQITMNIMRYFRLLEIPLRLVFPDPVTYYSSLIVTVISSSVLVSVLVTAISTASITSIIVWCVMRPHHDKPPVTTPSPPSAGGGGVIELAPVIYDIPITQHTITTQHNVAYGGTIPLKHNEAYQQIQL